MSEVITIDVPDGSIVLESDTEHGHMIFVLPETVEQQFEEMSEETRDRFLHLSTEYLGAVFRAFVVSLGDQQKFNAFGEIVTQLDCVTQRKS